MTTNDGGQEEAGKAQAAVKPRAKFDEAYPLKGQAYKWAIADGRYPRIATPLFAFYRERARKLGYDLNLVEAHEAKADFLKQQAAAKEVSGGRREESEDVKARRQRELEERIKKNSDERLDADVPPKMYRNMHRNGDLDVGVPCQYEGGCENEEQPKIWVLLDSFGMSVLYKEGPLAGQPVVVGEFTVRLGGANRMPEIARICRHHQEVKRHEAVKAGKMPPRFVPCAAAEKLCGELLARRAASDKAREEREERAAKEAVALKKRTPHFGGARDVGEPTHRRSQ